METSPEDTPHMLHREPDRSARESTVRESRAEARGTGVRGGRRLLGSQKVRFLLAGCTNTALDFLVLNALILLLHLPTLVANVFSVLLGITISYALNHFFVFRHQGRISWSTFAKFFAVTGFSSLVLQSVIIWGFEVFFDTRFGNSLLFLPSSGGNAVLAINVAKAFAVFVGLIWNFCMYKFVVFRASAKPAVPTLETVSPAAVTVAGEPLDVSR